MRCEITEYFPTISPPFLPSTLTRVSLSSRYGFKFPYCFDGDNQATTRAFGAVVTPDFFVYDSALSLVLSHLQSHSHARSHPYIHSYGSSRCGFKFNPSLSLISKYQVYRGSFDSTRPSNQGQFQPTTSPYQVEEVRVGVNSDGCHLRRALDALISGDDAKIKAIPQHPAEGCSIKWLKNGKEPSYSRATVGVELNFHKEWNRRYVRWKFVYDWGYWFLSIFGIRRPAIGNELQSWQVVGLQYAQGSTSYHNHS